MEQLYSSGTQENVPLFIGGISKETKIHQIISYMEQHSPVLQINMPVHKVTGKPIGYAFVKLADPGVAKWIVERPNRIGGRNVDIQFAIEREAKEFYKQDLLKRKIFIAGIKQYVNFQNIQKALEAHGLLKIFYRIETSHKNRGLAFAEFYDSNAAESVVAMGLCVDGCQLRVSYFRPKPEADDCITSQRRNSSADIKHLFTEESSILGGTPTISLDITSGDYGTRVNKSQTFQRKTSTLNQQKIGDSNYTFRIAIKENTSQTFNKISVKGATLYIKSTIESLNFLKRQANVGSSLETYPAQRTSPTEYLNSKQARDRGVAYTTVVQPLHVAAASTQNKPNRSKKLN